MSHVLTRCKFLATYIPSTEEYEIGPAVGGALSLDRAAGFAGISNPTGETFVLSIRYRDDAVGLTDKNRNYFEVGEFELLSNGRLKRVGQAEARNNNSWSGDVNALVIHSSVTNKYLQSIAKPSLSSPVYIGQAGAPAFLNGWQNWGAGYVEAGYLERDGILHTFGLVKSGTHNLPICTMPQELRPTKLLDQVVRITGGAFTNMQLKPNGDLLLPSSGGAVAGYAYMTASFVLSA